MIILKFGQVKPIESYSLKKSRKVLTQDDSFLHCLRSFPLIQVNFQAD